MSRALTAVFSIGFIALSAHALAQNDDTATVPDEDERIAMILRVFEDNDCSVSEDQAETLFPTAGLDKERDSYLIKKLIGDGMIRLSEDRRLATLIKGDLCAEQVGAANAEAEAARNKIIAAFEDNDCVLTEDKFMARFGDEAEPLKAVVETMFLAGAIKEVANDSGRLVIGGKCEKLYAERKSLLVDVLETNDCALTQADAKNVLSELGMTMDEVEKIAEAMVEAGEAKFEGSGDGEKLVLQIGADCGK